MNSLVKPMPLPVVPPHNMEAEQALLGALFLNNDAYGLVSSTIGPEHFFEEAHELIYRKFSEQMSSGRKVTPTTIMNSLPSIEVAPGITMPQYLARLCSEATSVIHAPDYARSIRDQSLMRSIIAIGEDLRAAQNRGVPPEEAIRLAFDDMDAIRGALSGNDVHRAMIGDLVFKVLDGESGKAIPTNLHEFDKVLGGGLRTGRLFIIGGRPGMGKTVLLCSMARRIARSGVGVSIFSLETDNREIACRLIADEMARTDVTVPYRNILANTLTEQEFGRVQAGAEALQALPIKVDDTSGLTLAEIEGRARIDRDRMAATAPLGVVMIDYLGLVRRGDRYRGRTVDEIAELTMAAKGMTKRLNVAVVMFAQLSRGVEGRDDKRPTMSDLRDSGAIEQDADVVGLLYRPAYYLERSTEYKNGDREVSEQLHRERYLLDFIVGKNRLGPASSINLWCDPALSAIDNWSRM